MAGRERVRNPQSKAAIVAAAERVVAEHGAAHLTLDAVAEEAGISKGGLLYNFPTKHALIAGLLETMLERGRAAAESLREEEGGGPDGGIRCRLACMLNKASDRSSIRAVLAAAAENPRLLEPVRQILEESCEDIVRDASDPIEALIVWLAADALVLRDVLGLDVLDPQIRQAIQRRLAEKVGLQEEHFGPADAPHPSVVTQ